MLNSAKWLKRCTQRHIIIYLMLSLLSWACCYHRCVLLFYTSHLMVTDARHEICLAATSMFWFSAMHYNLQN